MSMACQTSVDNFELVNRFLCFLLLKNMLYEIQNYGETERVLELHVAQTGKYYLWCYSSERHVRSITAVLFVVETLHLVGHSDTSWVLEEDKAS